VLTLDFPPLSPAETLAAEEALLDAAEAGQWGETLVFWEPREHFVVLGCGNKVATEVDRAACDRRGVPILRRSSGGGTVLQGPGVLNYCLILRIAENGPLVTIHGANQFIMQRNADALTRLLNAEHNDRNPKSEIRNAIVEVQGHTDLVLAGRKFSGNAQRRKRTHLLFHGAILRGLDLDLLEAILPLPSLQPEYRSGRSHRDFLTQLALPAEAIRTALREEWSAREFTAPPDWSASIHRLVGEKYGRAEWNFRV
jgi:lipoate-protein ligase A